MTSYKSQFCYLVNYVCSQILMCAKPFLVGNIPVNVYRDEKALLRVHSQQLFKTKVLTTTELRFVIWAARARIDAYIIWYLFCLSDVHSHEAGCKKSESGFRKLPSALQSLQSHLFNFSFFLTCCCRHHWWSSHRCGNSREQTKVFHTRLFSF